MAKINTNPSVGEKIVLRTDMPIRVNKSGPSYHYNEENSGTRYVGELCEKIYENTYNIKLDTTVLGEEAYITVFLKNNLGRVETLNNSKVDDNIVIISLKTIDK